VAENSALRVPAHDQNEVAPIITHLGALKKHAGPRNHAAASFAIHANLLFRKFSRHNVILKGYRKGNRSEGRGRLRRIHSSLGQLKNFKMTEGKKPRGLETPNAIRHNVAYIRQGYNETMQAGRLLAPW
jgi:hypothetical protein